jgi:hypothetical protein
MTPRLRKFALVAHVMASVGWLGAVAGWLALATAGLTSRDAQLVRGVYLAMELTAWSVLVPLSLASTLTGFVSSLGTRWGLVRHYWVLVKLLITVPATVLLLVHMKPIADLAGVAAETTLFSDDLAGRLRVQMVAYAVAALLVLILATALSVYKPRGKTLPLLRQSFRLLPGRLRRQRLRVATHVTGDGDLHEQSALRRVDVHAVDTAADQAHELDLSRPVIGNHADHCLVVPARLDGRRPPEVRNEDIDLIHRARKP